MAVLLCCSIAARPILAFQEAAPPNQDQRGERGTGTDTSAEQADRAAQYQQQEAAARAAERRDQLVTTIALAVAAGLVPALVVGVWMRRRRRTHLSPPPIAAPRESPLAPRAPVLPGQPAPSDIFLSYASEDRPRARELAHALERQGWAVWWDRKILPGRPFGQVIEEQLDSVKCVLVLWSKAAVASDWVEAEAARAKHRRILVPVLLDDVAAEIPIEFSRLHAANLQNWQGESTDEEFQELLAAVARHAPLAH